MQNPLASVKVGNITVSGSKYNKSNEVDLNYVKYAGKKINITFKAAKGWKVKQVDYAEKTFEKCKTKNGAKFSIRGGNRYRVLALMENKNIGETELVYVIFKENRQAAFAACLFFCSNTISWSVTI